MTRFDPRLLLWRIGIRRRMTLAFASGALGLASLLSLGTFFLARTYIIDQQVNSTAQQAYADAAYVRDGLMTSGRQISDVLASASPPSGTVLLIERGGVWYSSSLTSSSDLVPDTLTAITADGDVALEWTRLDGHPAIAVGVPLPVTGSIYYEISPAQDLERTLNVLTRAMIISTVLTVIAGALMGRWASSRLLVPLNAIAQASAQIAGGELNTRLRGSTDPELATIAASINAMLDALGERIDREARFTADVAHELRSPLTTLTTTVQVMEGRRDELPETSQRALDLMSNELSRFRAMLEDLLELGRLDAGEVGTRQVSDVAALALEALSMTGHDAGLLEVVDGPWWVDVDRNHLVRAMVNLIRNADVHGEGARLVRIDGDEQQVRISVHDAGPGIADADRERIFDRFGRGGSRGGRPGVGLGLSLVAESVRAHGGTVTQDESFLGGARFTITLPTAAHPSATEADLDEELEVQP